MLKLYRTVLRSVLNDLLEYRKWIYNYKNKQLEKNEVRNIIVSYNILIYKYVAYRCMTSLAVVKQVYSKNQLVILTALMDSKDAVMLRVYDVLIGSFSIHEFVSHISKNSRWSRRCYRSR